MPRPRPSIPIAIKVQVAERQLVHHDGAGALEAIRKAPGAQRLGDLLFALFAMRPVALDHNPPLRIRAYDEKKAERARARHAAGHITRREMWRRIAACYVPNANDPEHLDYRPTDPAAERSHHTKTYVRGDRGQFPDRVLIKRERKRERKAKKIKRIKHGAHFGRKTKVSGRSQWPTGRKIRNRSTWQR